MAWGPITPWQPPVQSDGGPTRALDRARRIFLTGSGAPVRWQGRQQFNLLDTHFGLGHKLLATWQAWRQDAQRCDRLCIVAVHPHPPTRDSLQKAHAQGGDAQRQGLLALLLAQWPPATPDLHVLDFEGGRLRLMLAFGRADRVLPDLVMQADAVYLDDPPNAPDQPATTELLRHLPRLCAPGATLAMPASDAAGHRALAAAGFERTPPLVDGEPEAMTRARFSPRHTPPTPPGRRTPPRPRRVAVIGAGVAGAAVARALALQGVEVVVLEAEAAPATAASGNAAGLFHSVLHAHDGAHARWLRAAGLHAQRVLQPLIASGQVPGRADGLLRGERTLAAPAMRAQLAIHHQPPEHVQVRPDGDHAGMPDGRPAWFFPGGGWVSPVDLVGRWLATPGVDCRTGARAQRLVARAPSTDPTDQNSPASDPPAWQVLAADGTLLAEADAVVLANAQDAVRLLNPTPAHAPVSEARIPTPWPLQRVRGQTTVLSATASGIAELPLELPLADGGYALRLADGRVLCGAVAQPGDEHPGLREADHRRHLATLQRLTGWTLPEPLPELSGKVGWRLVADDKLPLLGPVPDKADPAAPAADRRPLTQVRQLPRTEGLWVFTALGSRGLTVAALGGELMAARLLGLPWPVPASVADALDPARFQVRAARHASRPSAGEAADREAPANAPGGQAQSKDRA